MHEGLVQEDWPLLIVVPASLRLVWAEELERWLPHLRPNCIHVIYGGTNWPPPGRTEVIISVECMRRLRFIVFCHTKNECFT